MSNKLALYMHAGSYNHGCEAIIRSTVDLFSDKPITLYSSNEHEDRLYGVDRICRVEPALAKALKRTPFYLFSRLVAKLLKDNTLYWKQAFHGFLDAVTPGALYLSTGGDNYCYPSKRRACIFLNREITKRGGQTVLWGTSIEPSLLQSRAVRRDLARYTKIVARESITLEALREAGLTNAVYCPDPAFLLPAAAGVERVFPEDIIGINLSPMALDYAADGETTRRAYLALIRDILENTDHAIYLVPHVVWKGGDDREAMRSLYDEIEQKERVFLVPDCDCMTLKAYIGHCRFFVGARTHATIAAYSQGIPTLVVGYSVKARGIARDLFGSWEDYVKPVQQITDDGALVRAFAVIRERETWLRDTLAEKLSEQATRYEPVKQALLDLSE